MRIAQFAPLVEAVPPSGYGGIEMIVSLLTEELVRLGHEVTLFASGDSQTKAKLVSVIDGKLRDHKDIKLHLWQCYDYQSLLELQARAGEFDLVHNHMGWQALPFLKDLAIPSLTTNHNIVERACEPIFRACKDLPYAAISESYKKRNLPEVLNYVGTVYNGIDCEAYSYDENSSRDYLLFLGRICNDKGTVEAVEIAKRLGMRLIMAGKVDHSDKEYFLEHVKPLLTATSNIEFIGEVGLNDKVDLFRNAHALVYPINFEEPFGLVLAEAQASGVPALALRRGAVPEVVIDGKTAIVADTIDQLCERFSEIEKIDRKLCRQNVCTNFSKEVMTKRYLEVYADLLKKPDGRPAPIEATDISDDSLRSLALT